jgi:hypothetical protein
VIGPFLHQETSRYQAPTEQQVLLIMPHWLGAGQYYSVTDIHIVCKARAFRTAEKLVGVSVGPSASQHDVTSANFNKFRWMFLICRCVDGKLIEINASMGYEPNFIGQHENHPVNVMVLCRPQICFMT